MFRYGKWHRSVTLIEIECCRSVVFVGVVLLHIYIVQRKREQLWIGSARLEHHLESIATSTPSQDSSFPFTLERGVHRLGVWSESKGKGEFSENWENPHRSSKKTIVMWIWLYHVFPQFSFVKLLHKLTTNIIYFFFKTTLQKLLWGCLVIKSLVKSLRVNILKFLIYLEYIFATLS